MVEVAVERRMVAPLSRVSSFLTPRSIVEYEGRHTPRGVSSSGDRTVVTARPNGRLLAYEFVFERRDDGYVYRLANDQRPVRVETRLRLTGDGDGTVVSLRSRVEPTLPVPLLGRVVARGRRRALESLCDRLETELG